MPRRKGKKKNAEPKNTYYKAKNGRFYKKVQIDGKTRVRFVSNAEATGAMKLSKPKPKRTRKKKETKAEPETKSETDGAEQVEETEWLLLIIDNILVYIP